MASSLISNSHHIDFESVFRLDDAGMVQMFETLIATGLKEFLDCPAVFYEDALTEFFANSSVRQDGMVVSTISGTAIEISQAMFAAAFQLPTEGLIDLTDVPKNFVFDARSLFSDSKEKVSMSCLKKALKFHYRLLHDILEKTIYVKAGSFDSVTRDRFLLMTAITFDIKINWSSLLFGVFKEMVTPGSRQAKGYAIQICVLLRNVPGLELGSGSESTCVCDASERDLKENEKLMMEWAKTNTLATAVRRQMYVLTKYREIILRTFLESFRRFLALDQPWTDMAVQVISLLSAAHSQSLEDFKAQQQEHKIDMVQPNSSLPVIDSIDRSGVRLAHFYSIAKSICWVRPMVLIDEVWMPLQRSGYWRSNCKLSLFVDRKRLPENVVAENFDSQVSLIEPARYWGAAPLLIKIWAWQRVCTEAIQFSVSGRLRPASFSSDIVIGNLGFERLPDYFLDDFEQGVNTDYFAEFLSGSSGQSDSEFDSASSSGDTVYRSPSPPDYAYALGPPIHESTCEIRSKVNDVEFSVRGDLLKQQSWLRQTFQNACEVLERQSTQMNDLKKGLMATVGTIFQDLFDIQKNQRAQEAKLNALDGQVAAIRNEQLEFQNKISADLLSLSTQFAAIVDYIRGGDAKNGKGGSSSRPPPVRVERRPLPTPQSPRDVAGGSSAVRIPTFPRTTGILTERAEQARRHILESGLAITLEEAAERVRQADNQESDRVQRE
ncbi:hypothetical protein F511_15777 [Dorcoceras hygrometricum]|nr:hypothetical protein F511_15777 [Dorcoceras hygrometricum]